jgi:hypothetical protein
LWSNVAGGKIAVFRGIGEVFRLLARNAGERVERVALASLVGDIVIVEEGSELGAAQRSRFIGEALDTRSTRNSA